MESFATPHFRSPPGPSMRQLIRDSVLIAWHRALVIATTIGLSLLSAYLINQYWPERFRAHATLKLDILRLSGGGDAGVPTSFLADDLIINTEISLLASPAMRAALVDATGATALFSDPNVSPEAQRQQAMRAINAGVKIAREGNTSLITIYFTSDDPVQSARIANAYAETYLTSKISEIERGSATLRVELTRQLAHVNAKLRTAEARSREFAVANRLPYDNEKSIFEVEVDTLARALLEIDRRRAQAELELGTIAELAIENADPSELSGAILAIAINEKISTLQAEYLQAFSERQRLQGRGGVAITSLDVATNVEGKGRLILQLIQGARQSAAANLRQINRQKNALEQGLAIARRAVEASLADQIKLRELRATEAVYRREAENLNQRLAALAQAADLSRLAVEQVTIARAPTEPLGRNETRLYFGATAIGAILAFGLILLDRQIIGRVELISDIDNRAGRVKLHDFRRVESDTSAKLATLFQPENGLVFLAVLPNSRAWRLVLDALIASIDKSEKPILIVTSQDNWEVSNPKSNDGGAGSRVDWLRLDPSCNRQSPIGITKSLSQWRASHDQILFIGDADFYSQRQLTKHVHRIIIPIRYRRDDIDAINKAIGQWVGLVPNRIEALFFRRLKQWR